MAENRDNNPLLSWPGMLGLTALVSSLFWLISPLRSSRPSDKPVHERTSIGDQDIEARLWQDPVGAILERRKEFKDDSTTNDVQTRSEKDTRFSVGEIARQIERRFTFLADESRVPTNILILQVMIPGGPYVEDAESRRRSRYAVVSALSVGGYVPWDADHIGYFNVPWLRGAELQRTANSTIPALSECIDSQPSITVPFEWFQPNELQPPDPKNVPLYGMILVWWLRDDAFDDHPLKRLAQLKSRLDEGITNATMRRKIQFKLINPRVKRILDEVPKPETISVRVIAPDCTRSTNGVTNVLNGVEMYSPWATTADALLIEGASNQRRETIRQKFKKWGQEFHNATCTDDQLATNLIHELSLRGVDLVMTNHSVALISEWDTFYGRALPMTFAAAIKSHGNLGDFDTVLMRLKTNKAEWPSNIYLFTYLRGIDGLLPGQSPPRTEAGKEKTKAEEIEKLERPEGQSQLDYMPRMALELKERERESVEHPHDHKPLSAIGVLGSDVYDKLLLLQSLHNLFPNVIFFTTDLDARLLHPAELAWSRNLIVASSFDLELGEELQKGLPPFRDSYQTGQYLACLAAVGHIGTDVLTNISPRIFEVGRNGAYVLDTTESQLYTSRPEAFSRTVKFWPVLAGFFAFCLICSFSRNFIRILAPGKKRNRRKRVFCARCWGACFLLAMLFYGVIRQQHRNPDGEPFSLFDGISIWPTEILRMVSFGLSVLFIFKVIFELAKSNRRLTEEYALPILIGGRYVKWWKQWLSANIYRWESKGDKVPAASLWLHYLWLGTRRNRLWRIVPAVVVYLGLGFSVFIMFDKPFRPFRGPTSNLVDIGLLVLSSFALICLIFLVVDAALLCRQFVQNLSAKPTEWPQGLLHRHAKARNMAYEHLDEWLDIQLIAERTKVVGKFIYYPFVVLFIMIVARNNFFDHFDWPISLLLIFGINTAYAFYCAFALRRSTEEARREELKRLEEKLVKARGAGDEQAAATIELTVEQINAMDEGAFAPWSNQPFIHAILVPLGGSGLITLAQYLFSR